MQLPLESAFKPRILDGRILDRTETGVQFRYDAVHVDFILTKAA